MRLCVWAMAHHRLTIGVILTGRRYLRPCALRLLERAGAGSKIASVDRAVQKEGFKVIALMRMTPAFPFAFTTLMFALTSVDHVSHCRQAPVLNPYTTPSWFCLCTSELEPRVANACPPAAKITVLTPGFYLRSN